MEETGYLGPWAKVRAGLAAHQPQLVGATDKKRAAVALVIGPVADGWQLLFIERARHPEDPWSGHIAFPGGGIEAADASPQAAAERETREEVGLDLTEAQYWGRLDDLTGHMLPVAVAGFVYCLPGPVVLEPNEEVGAVFWVAAETLCNPGKRTQYCLRRRDGEQVYPALDLLGPKRPVLWGLTFRFVRQLIGWIEAP
ncbi:MAG: NUDIX domain-containing protein [Candidatus Latescibacteria bacterium]|nr:NUDIX domain-containing protein [Candidatus Latescibacterota bacterium]